MRTFFRPHSGDRHPVAHREDNLLATLTRFARTWQVVLETRRQRRMLMALDDRMLSDIGLSRSQAFREGSKTLLDFPRDLI